MSREPFLKFIDECLLSGKTYDSVAELLGVSEMTLTQALGRLGDIPSLSDEKLAAALLSFERQNHQDVVSVLGGFVVSADNPVFMMSLCRSAYKYQAKDSCPILRANILKQYAASCQLAAIGPNANSLLLDRYHPDSINARELTRARRIYRAYRREKYTIALNANEMLSPAELKLFTNAEDLNILACQWYSAIGNGDMPRLIQLGMQYFDLAKYFNEYLRASEHIDKQQVKKLIVLACLQVVETALYVMSNEDSNSIKARGLLKNAMEQMLRCMPRKEKMIRFCFYHKVLPKDREVLLEHFVGPKSESSDNSATPPPSSDEEDGSGRISLDSLTV